MAGCAPKFDSGVAPAAAAAAAAALDRWLAAVEATAGLAMVAGAAAGGIGGGAATEGVLGIRKLMLFILYFHENKKCNAIKMRVQ